MTDAIRSISNELCQQQTKRRDVSTIPMLIVIVRKWIRKTDLHCYKIFSHCVPELRKQCEHLNFGQRDRIKKKKIKAKEDDKR